MTVLDEVLSEYESWQRKWKNGKLPPDIGFMPDGFETAETDSQLVESFQMLIDQFSYAPKIKLTAQVSVDLERQFCGLIFTLTNHFPANKSYLLEVNKQSASIVVNVWVPTIVDLNSLYTPFGGRGEWTAKTNSGYTHWHLNNTLFGFYLIAIGHKLGIT